MGNGDTPLHLSLEHEQLSIYFVPLDPTLSHVLNDKGKSPILTVADLDMFKRGYEMLGSLFSHVVSQLSDSTSLNKILFWLFLFKFHFECFISNLQS